MKLSNLEAYVPAKLYNRGVDYFERDYVEELRENAPNRWHALVSGTRDYHVSINLTGKETVSSTSCNCPFESDSLCKHEVAVCLAIVEYKEENPGGAADVLPKLKAMKKVELLKILEDLLQQQPAVNQYLVEKFSEPVEMNDNVARRLIRKSASRASRRGFIEWDRTDDAVEGALEVQEYLDALHPQQDSEVLIRFNLIIIEECTEMLQIADDSSGSIGMVIDESLANIQEAMEQWPEQLSEERVDRMLELLYPQILFGLEQGITNAAEELTESVMQWTSQGEYSDKIYGFIEKIIASKEMQNKTYHYDEERFRTYQLAILQEQGDKEKIESFCQKHRSYPDIRKAEIALALNQGEFKKAVRLCEESEQQDSALPGLVYGWKELRFKAYEELNSVPEMIELAYTFTVEGNETYYGKLKNLVDSEQWPAMLEKLLVELKTKARGKALYVIILIDEKRTEDLLEYCRSNVSGIETLYPHLMGDYPHEVNEIFTSYIYRSIESASDRKKYQAACDKIETFQNALGAEAARGLIEELKFMYPKRKALLDELSKIQ
ncbi:hypothetical protein A1A1_17110 [Planococcus antarcticus DSM 14505]|uniref:SWIM-type domain-containing protein n=1 Tax=Planococcus antarcticus DSM 14505 TaxID=1185653 RepID=A0AA87IIZ3_9BACL|nr:hypothetical protein [Planococcus antarcticus]EIM05269.1 hypothetical protein A1A1_17110 [Planococcus antarcticus DSM 14505]